MPIKDHMLTMPIKDHMLTMITHFKVVKNLGTTIDLETHIRYGIDSFF